MDEAIILWDGYGVYQKYLRKHLLVWKRLPSTSRITRRRLLLETPWTVDAIPYFRAYAPAADLTERGYITHIERDGKVYVRAHPPILLLWEGHGYYTPLPDGTFIREYPLYEDGKQIRMGINSIHLDYPEQCPALSILEKYTPPNPDELVERNGVLYRRIR